MIVKPYVSVSAVRNPEEARLVRDLFLKIGYSLETSVWPVVGVCTNYNSINGRPDNRRCPLEEIPAIMEAAAGSLISLHYDPNGFGNLRNDISKILEHGNIAKRSICKAVQLNVKWPDRDVIYKLKDMYPELKVILPVHRSSIYEERPDEIAEKILHYQEDRLLDYVLLDSSSGNGQEFDTNNVALIHNAIKSKTEVELVVAGGLSPDNLVEKITALRDRVQGDFSVDAESGLRTDDLLDTEKVERYIKEAAKVMKPNH